MKMTGFFVLSALVALPLAGCGLAPRQGDKAPSFTATLDNGQQASLEQLMGEKGVVLYFYPKDETPGCTTQACTFQDKLVDFEKLGYKVVGVSEDTGVSHQAFKSKNKLTFNLVSDTNHTIADLYNVPVKEDQFGSKGFERTTFIITKDGVIQRVFKVEGPKEQVNRAYEALREPF
jgi:peroxiredoxin Q/BCP